MILEKNTWNLEYSEHSILSGGKYAGKRVWQIPREYLLQIWENKNTRDELLLKYIEKNLHTISHHEGAVAESRCEKIPYLTEEIADMALEKIKKSPGGNTKPTHSYHCPKCKYWHHTSSGGVQQKKFKK